ncbi:hypothetical protein PR048_005473 [Dryococelus australis]|uniref:DDE Tnp4 domain-containing protein n=1 Tax=Dryococelus australis TaxID=614101 RepID=A0ABQ9I892_9NEOP|nr:hypothetical protein PR048_005473 [Dryococelus australis]
MSKEYFNLLFVKVQNSLHYVTKNYREIIAAEERLVITCRYMASEESFNSLALIFKMGKITVAEIVHDTCRVLWYILEDEHLPTPKKETWLSAADIFENRWNFPNCFGCIDGKHIRKKCPANILLLAVADADRRLLTVDTRSLGRQNDGGNFRTLNLFRLLETGKLYVAECKPLLFTGLTVPFVLLGDEGYH